MTAMRIQVVCIVSMLLLLPEWLHAQQRFFAEKGQITFFSDAVVEDITAVNGKVTSIFDVRSGDIAFLTNNQNFQFVNKLMQVHFNEKYIESERFPKSTFNGKVTGFDPQVQGVQLVTAKGKLFIHGVTREVEIPASIEVTGNQLTAKSSFKIKLEDYQIKVPQIVWKNIAQVIDVHVEFVYRPL